MPGAGGIAAIGIGTSLLSGFLGSGGGDAAQEAAAAQAAGKQQAIATLQKNLSPFVEAGSGALPGLQEASTAQGLDARLQEIFAGGSFRGLVDERTRAVENRNAAGGNFRSGAGLLAAAQVPTDVGLGLEGLLQGRLGNLANIGLGAAGNLGGGVAGLQAGIGRDIGSGIITGQQADASNLQNALNTGVGIAGLFKPQQGAPLTPQPQGAQFTQQPGGPGPGPTAAIGANQTLQASINQLFGEL